MWRCDKIHEFEDLIQDAYLLFIKLCERYPRVVEPAAFMALYKSSLSNQIHDHSRYMKRKRDIHAEPDKDVSDLYTDLIGEPTNYGYIQATLNEAPEELKMALNLLENSPELLRDPHPQNKRENFNARLRRILGIENKFDFTNTLKNLLEEA